MFNRKSPHKSFKNNGWMTIVRANKLMFIIVPIMIIGIIGITSIQYSSATTYQSCTVTDKDRVHSSDNGQSDMRVYSSCGVFHVKDMALNMDFDSADLFNSIEEGKTYDFDTTGKRIPFLSMFPIIRNASEV